MDLVIMFILGAITGAGWLIIVAYFAINTANKTSKPKSKEEWRELE